MKKTHSLIVALLMASALCNQAEATIPMPAPVVGGLIKAVMAPVNVVVKGSVTIVKKTVQIVTKPVKSLTR